MLIFYCSMLETEHEKNKMSEIYNKYRKNMLWYALKITKNHESAEDAVHNAFIDVINKKEKYLNMNDNEVIRLLIIIVRFKCIDILRKNKNEESYEELDDEIQQDTSRETVEEQAITLFEYDSICKHLYSIDEVSRQIIILKYYHNLSSKEIGSKLNLKMTPKHIDIKVMRAKEKIRKLIEKGETENGYKKDE